MFAKSGLATAPCGVPSSVSISRPFFEHTCCQPLADQPDNPTVANPMLDKAGQPLPADFVEEGLNVTVEDPIDPLLPDPERQRIERLVLVALRSEPVAEDTACRLCVRAVFCRSAFSSVPPLRSSGSAAVVTALFARFRATLGRSDFSIAVARRLVNHIGSFEVDIRPAA